MKGIYLITNNINNKKYVGLSNNISRRFMEHKTPKNMNKKTNISKAFKKYGLLNFTFEILFLCESENQLNEKEMYYIELIKPEYNMNKGGTGNLGHTLSEEAKEHLSILNKKKWS